MSPRWDNRIILALMSLILVAITAGCPTQRTAQGANTAGRGGPLSGTWRGSNPGLTVVLDLRQGGDSLVGAGNFRVQPTSSIGCGGETLPATGAVSLTGQLVGRNFQGRMNFAGSWTPPYVASIVPPDTLNGHFMSVDRGGCPLVLVRQR